MFAVIETGGKQFRVQKGDKIKVEKLPLEEGETFIFDKILLISEDGNINLGTPLIKEAAVSGKILSNGKDKKINVLKFQPKKRLTKKKGHRQFFSEVEILEIDLSGKLIKKVEKTKSTLSISSKKIKNEDSNDKDKKEKIKKDSLKKKETVKASVSDKKTDSSEKKSVKKVSQK